MPRANKSKSSEYGVIYEFTNKINGKKYIGQTWNFERRKRDHFNRRGGTTIFSLAIKKHGESNFSVKILFKTANQEILDNIEIICIKLLNTTNTLLGYNLQPGGHGVGKHSEDAKRMIGDSHRGKIVSDETKAKLRLANLGKVMPQETKDKIRASTIGKFVSLETREKIGIANALRNKDIKIYMFNCFTHEKLKEFKNKTEMINNTGLTYNQISNSLNPRLQTKFMYDNIFCYATFTDEPSSKKFRIGRGKHVEVTSNDGNVTIYETINYAKEAVGLNINSLSKMLNSNQTSYIKNNKIIFTAKFVD